MYHLLKVLRSVLELFFSLVEWPDKLFSFLHQLLLQVILELYVEQVLFLGELSGV